MERLPMNKCICGLLIFVFSLSAIATENPVVNIQTWQAKNGAKVFFVQAKELPMVDVQVVFAAGSVYDGKFWGLSSLTNNLMGQGTTNQTADQIAEKFDRVGAQFSVDSDRDMATLQLRTLSDPRYFDLALQDFADVLTNATLPEDAFKRTKSNTLAAIKLVLQKPRNVAMRTFNQLVFTGQSYAHEPLGTLASVKALTRSQAVGFYKRFYVAKNADVIIVGDLSLSHAKQVADFIVGKLPPGQPAPKQPYAPLSEKAISKHINYPATQTTIVLGQVGITRENPAYFPLVVGNYALGGMPLSSILFKEVRDQRGLAYFVYSRFIPLKFRGSYRIQLQTKASNTNKALTVVQDTLRRFVKEGPSQAELDAAKNNLIGSFLLGLSSNSDILDVVTSIAFYDRPLNFLDTYRANVQKVTVEQVKNAFLQTVHPNKMVTVTVGPNVG